MDGTSMHLSRDNADCSESENGKVAKIVPVIGKPASRRRQENTGIETHARDQNRNEVGFRDATS